MKAKWLFLLSILLFCQKSTFAQEISYMGASYPDVLKKMKKSVESYNRCNRCILNQYSYEEKVDSSIFRKDKNYLELTFIGNSNPKQNYTKKFYFNTKGYCDSAVVFEYECSQNELFEDENKMVYFGFSIWNKVSPNRFISRDVYPILYPEVNKNSKKCAFIQIQRDPNPSDGICRKWIITMGDELNLKINKRYLRERDSNDRLLMTTLKIEGIVLGLITLVGIITTWGLK